MSGENMGEETKRVMSAATATDSTEPPNSEPLSPEGGEASAKDEKSEAKDDSDKPEEAAASTDAKDEFEAPKVSTEGKDEGSKAEVELSSDMSPEEAQAKLDAAQQKLSEENEAAQKAAEQKKREEAARIASGMDTLNDGINENDELVDDLIALLDDLAAKNHGQEQELNTMRLMLESGGISDGVWMELVKMLFKLVGDGNATSTRTNNKAKSALKKYGHLRNSKDDSNESDPQEGSSDEE